LTQIKTENIKELIKKVCFLEDALDEANNTLKENGLLGVIPARTVTFRESSKFYSRVRNIEKSLEQKTFFG